MIGNLKKEEAAGLHDADAIHSEKRPLLPASAKEFILRKVSEATSARAVPRDALALLLGQEAAANGRDRGSASPPAPPAAPRKPPLLFCASFHSATPAPNIYGVLKGQISCLSK